tara:strand:- start:48 stop:503 length:456 start_codon:yes stop_codon:yes gene_type:complete
MKKLLLLLLLIPNLAMAGDNFILICEGESNNWDKGSKGVFSYPKKIAVQVRKEALIIEEQYWFINEDYKQKNIEVSKSYSKKKDSIFGLYSVKSEVDGFYYWNFRKVNISRITGDISYRFEYNDKYTDGSHEGYSSWSSFKGKCKKSDRAF